MHDIAEQWLDWRVVHPMVRQWQALIEPDVTVDTRKIYSTEAFYADVEIVRSRSRPCAGAHAARIHRAAAGVLLGQH